ncbi:hypothetical protein DXG01_012341 [Tephrocybe rancida]|nr:hypothetical protein DXG01_012341 [Tephrocybe rancida]
MSAIRASRRRASATPYSRPIAKKSSWSISGFLKSLNPWASTEVSDVDDVDAMNEDVTNSPDSPAASLRDRGFQIQREMQIQRNVPRSPPRRPPVTPKVNSPMFDPTSPPKDLETVSAQIRESLGQTELERLCVLLKGDSPASPSTPVRANSPYRGGTNSIEFTFGASSSAQAPTSTPRKTLSKNPNGVYRWQGGGSAKASRSKNRYSSPAFGPSQSTPERLILKDTQIGMETPRSDTKRRKVFDEPNPFSGPSGSNSALSNNASKPVRAAGPDPSPTRVKQALPFPVSVGSPATPRTSGDASSTSNSSPSTSRSRVPPLIQKPTMPVVPSPLRQTWSGASPPSRSDPTSVTPSPSKQTKAANYMAELIKEVTPPKRPDLSNPYQTASPLGKVGSAPKARTGRRVRATGKPAAPTSREEAGKEKDRKDTDKDKIYSPQAIIEATLPKGSKRSRPPTYFDKASDRDTSPNEEQSRASLSAFIREELKDPEDEQDDEDAQRAAKKPKSHFSGRGVPTAVRNSESNSSDIIIIEEIEDVDSNITPEKPQSFTSPPLAATTAASSTLPGRSAFSGVKTASAPKNPSKLKYSYQPDMDTSPAPVPAPSLPAPASSTRSIFSDPTSAPRLAPMSLPSSSAPASPPPAAPASVSAPSVAPSTSTFSFSSPSSSSTDSPKDNVAIAQQAALQLPRSSLPTFAFSIQVTAPPSDSAHTKAIAEAMLVPKRLLPRFNFGPATLADIAAAKAAKAKKANGSPASAPLTLAPVVAAPAVQAFNWAAAGIKPPTATDSWICSLCSLSNPASVTDKCTTCEAPRVTAPPPPKVQGFNWAAAGIKPPTVSDSWTCSLCGLSNPASVTDKCSTCEAPRG